MKQAPSAVQASDEFQVALGRLIADLEEVLEQLHEPDVRHERAKGLHGRLAELLGREDVVDLLGEQVVHLVDPRHEEVGHDVLAPASARHEVRIVSADHGVVDGVLGQQLLELLLLQRTHARQRRRRRCTRATLFAEPLVAITLRAAFRNQFAVGDAHRVDDVLGLLPADVHPCAQPHLREGAAASCVLLFHEEAKRPPSDALVLISGSDSIVAPERHVAQIRIGLHVKHVRMVRDACDARVGVRRVHCGRRHDFDATAAARLHSNPA
mmetsp:Transcript_40026/g.105934  ORF Transcript_40026/g.105934 Transcript_40026/m.105934 type:complete len:268 (-) Transcript_40026:2-805(-)